MSAMEQEMQPRSRNFSSSVPPNESRLFVLGWLFLLLRSNKTSNSTARTEMWLGGFGLQGQYLSLWCWGTGNCPCRWKASLKDTILWQMPGHQSLGSAVLCKVRQRVRGLAVECSVCSALGFCKLNGCPLLHKPYIGCLCCVNYSQAPFPINALFKIAFLCWWCTHLELDLLCSLLPCGKHSPVGSATWRSIGQ